jgi:hypothetical protein
MSSAFKDAFDELKALGIVLTQAPGEYRVNLALGARTGDYVTETLQDALNHGRRMAERSPATRLPPLGPTGKRSTRRGDMYRHNRKLAASRQRRYLAAVAMFAETEDCSPVESVPLHPRCIEIARQFGKSPQEVAADINRVYLDSYTS